MQIWTSQAIADGVPLTDDMILQQKGLEFAKTLNVKDQLKCTNGWVYRFKLQNGLQRINMSGEANSAPLETLPEEHETGLFFRMEPNQTLGTGKISGQKKDKTRVSILFCANATSSHKFRPLVWMRADIFIEWLHHLDNYFCIMNQKILLLIDNAGSHFNPKVFEETNSDLSESDEEEVAESSHSAQNRKKAKKKGISPSSDCIIDDVNIQGIELNKLNELNEINLDLLPEADDLQEYFHMLDHDIPTEEHLTYEQIITNY
uniref:HTH CENPB-type domain-containing protein n=1 Tax=Rhizophagus irregularis (strain DAOM 181602 / DAOM 197198 / MUCL 43194) TaxID=747089 RepID=U9UD34_RHIID